MGADLPPLRLQRCLSVDLIARAVHAALFPLLSLTQFLFLLLFRTRAPSVFKHLTSSLNRLYVAAPLFAASQGTLSALSLFRI